MESSREAETLFRESISYDERFAIAHYQLGALLEQSERTEDAVKLLERAAALDETYAAPHYALARIYRRQGQRREGGRGACRVPTPRTPRRAAPASDVTCELS